MTKTKNVTLPAWAAFEDEARGVIVVDPDVLYPALLAELKALDVPAAEPAEGETAAPPDPMLALYAKLDPAKPDQYWLEVAYQCMKMDLQAAMGRFGFTIKLMNKPDWALKTHPKGRGMLAASKGKEARAHYQRLRGYIPA